MVRLISTTSGGTTHGLRSFVPDISLALVQGFRSEMLIIIKKKM